MTNDKHIQLLRLASEARDAKATIHDLQALRFEGSFDDQLLREMEIVKRSKGYGLLIDELCALILGGAQ